tara:strand:- start:560 stop:1066 length:507 start_codon:yes stop_codon:yes gene_type:complete
MTLKSEWLSDINDMHYKFGTTEWVDNMHRSKNYKVLKDFLAFRLDFLEEEFEETLAAFMKGDHKEVVDGLIDLIVIAIGTLDLFKCDADEVWDKIHNSNMLKEPGTNKSRQNPFGLPDMVKPEGWVGPKITEKNCGILPDILTKLELDRNKRDLENEFKNNIANSQYE